VLQSFADASIAAEVTPRISAPKLIASAGDLSQGERQPVPLFQGTFRQLRNGRERHAFQWRLLAVDSLGGWLARGRVPETYVASFYRGFSIPDSTELVGQVLAAASAAPNG